MGSGLRFARCLICALLFLITAQVTVNRVSAQARSAVPSPSPQASPAPSLERRFFNNIMQDQRAIWTAPLHLNRGDIRWVVPLGLSMTALIATDQEMDEFGYNRRRSSISRDISLAGSIYSTGGIATAFYLVGRATGNRRARETGLLGGEALIDSGIVFTALKNITRRQRPDHDEGQGEFFERGHSFPSGHAASAWALATVVANEYRTHRAVQISAYSFATAVSISRYTGRNHFLSDVLAGSAIGYGIGRYVYRRNHNQSLDSDDGQAIQRTRGKRFPLIAPCYARRNRSYGATLTWNL